MSCTTVRTARPTIRSKRIPNEIKKQTCETNNDKEVWELVNEKITGCQLQKIKDKMENKKWKCVRLAICPTSRCQLHRIKCKPKNKRLKSKKKNLIRLTIRKTHEKGGRQRAMLGNEDRHDRRRDDASSHHEQEIDCRHRQSRAESWDRVNRESREV